MSLEQHFDPVFTTFLALREKQIQQNYRPVIGVHKWFARRPGTVFRNLLLAEFNGVEGLDSSYWRAHNLRGVIADPFMGGGTPIIEANRLGFSVVGTDINPIAYWVVRQSLLPLNFQEFKQAASRVISDVDATIGDFYKTQCERCDRLVDVKYFLWVKFEKCPHCKTINDLFPSHLLAEAVRHPKHVLTCSKCGALNEFEKQPTRGNPAECCECRAPVHREGAVAGARVKCRKCGLRFAYPHRLLLPHPPDHRLWAIEYHCRFCKSKHNGRFFKKPDQQDLDRWHHAEALLAKQPELPIPTDVIPEGDETTRLLRWGYRRYRELFNSRQLVGLGVLLQRIMRVEEREIRYALLTVFSDFLRYQNMLCRYDTYALKCQDIFSVHGFPVGLVQCENSLLGITGVGSGAFRHFVEKYIRAKRYCAFPFETKFDGTRKKLIPIKGEKIRAELVQEFPTDDKQAWLSAASATTPDLPPSSLDGVFTDPPYFNNVQYAELIDFCFVWLRLGLKHEFPEFELNTTRNERELTGNVTLGRGIEHFTEGLSHIFSHYSVALKPSAPFVFTYHHNNPFAYVPLVVSILDAGMTCTATLPAAAEMSASLHIAGTGSSILDSVFVCRKTTEDFSSHDHISPESLRKQVSEDLSAMRAAGVHVREGDVRCLITGHIVRTAIRRLRPIWDCSLRTQQRIEQASKCLRDISREIDLTRSVQAFLGKTDVESAAEVGLARTV